MSKNDWSNEPIIPEDPADDASKEPDVIGPLLALLGVVVVIVLLACIVCLICRHAS